MAEIKIPGLGDIDEIKDGKDQELRPGTEKSDNQHAFWDAGRTDKVVIAVDGRSGCIDVRGRTYNTDIRGDGVQEIHGRIIIRHADRVVTIILDGKTGSIKQSGDHEAPRIFTDYLKVKGKADIEDLEVNLTTKTQFLEVGDQVKGNLKVEAEIKTNSLDVATLAKTQFLEVGDQVKGSLKIQETTTTKNLEVAKTATVDKLIANTDIVLQNADCAEEFDVVETTNQIEPGMVMILGEEGKVCQSTKAYDKKVVGVISGAGDYRPGLILDKQSPTKGNRYPIALMGKVYCKVDADPAPVEVGDLLTTSPRPGHAMKAEDPFKAFGAVIGKALSSLESGQGLIPILVTLQ